MRGYTGSAALRLWNNTLHSPTGESPTFTMVVRDPAVLRWLVLDRNPIQILASRRDHGKWPVPLTRCDLYAPSP